MWWWWRRTGKKEENVILEAVVVVFVLKGKSKKEGEAKKPSLETQGQIVGAKESLNGPKNMARRKVKKGEKSSWGQRLTRPVPNGRCRSDF